MNWKTWKIWEKLFIFKRLFSKTEKEQMSFLDSELEMEGELLKSGLDGLNFSEATNALLMDQQREDLLLRVQAVGLASEARTKELEAQAKLLEVARKNQYLERKLALRELELKAKLKSEARVAKEERRRLRRKFFADTLTALFNAIGTNLKVIVSNRKIWLTIGFVMLLLSIGWLAKNNFIEGWFEIITNFLVIYLPQLLKMVVAIVLIAITVWLSRSGRLLAWFAVVQAWLRSGLWKRMKTFSSNQTAKITAFGVSLGNTLSIIVMLGMLLISYTGIYLGIWAMAIIPISIMILCFGWKASYGFYFRCIISGVIFALGVTLLL
ncbi:MAG TPA: hypothetical protein PKD79_00860 [Candidatus Doudnabacteria bacterium]|nr:hypothetical protein [Candidatus Doudnabacteria bacterium]